MTLIPNDVGVRLRLQNELPTLQPITPVGEIPTDLPELRPGQTFTARIQEVLPENTFKALVGGKALTLSLPEGAKAGDTLELVVLDRSAKVVFAQTVASGEASGSAGAYPYTTLSRTGQLIGALLPHEGETPPPATLNRGQALLAAGPVDSRQLAQTLSSAIAGSGVFYEAHQTRWLAGQMPLAQLLQEPQAGFSHAATLLAAGILPRRDLLDVTAKSAEGSSRSEAGGTLLQALFGNAEERETPAGTGQQAANAVKSMAEAIPEALRPLVQQQLDALASMRIAWHGELWPQQTMDWEIEWPRRQGGDADETAEEWQTSLRLHSPRLGEVSARLQLNGEGVRIAIATPEERTATDLRAAGGALADTLAAAGVPLLGFLVHHEQD